jgi:hypothetical protein
MEESDNPGVPVQDVGRLAATGGCRGSRRASVGRRADAVLPAGADRGHRTSAEQAQRLSRSVTTCTLAVPDERSLPLRVWPHTSLRLHG